MRPTPGRLGFLFAVLVVITAGGCGQPKTTHGPDEKLEPGKWAVNGVSIGDTAQQVFATLGPGKKLDSSIATVFGLKGEVVSSEVRFHHYRFERDRDGRSIDANVKFDADMRVLFVWGDRLSLNDKLLLGKGTGQNELENKLGIGFVLRTFVGKHDFIPIIESVPFQTGYFYHDPDKTFQLRASMVHGLGKIKRTDDSSFYFALSRWAFEPEKRYKLR